MATVIRLSRGGSKKRPYYKIVVADSRMPRDGRFIERLGSYNPLLAKDDDKRVVLDTDRAKHWLSVGAQPSDRVLRFLDAAGVMERKARNNPNRAEPGEKAKERAEEKAAKLVAAEEAKQALEAAPAEEEAKVEEAAPEADAAPAAEAAPEAEAQDEAPVEAAKVEDAPAEKAPAEEAKADEAPAEDAKAEEAKADAAEKTEG